MDSNKQYIDLDGSMGETPETEATPAASVVTATKESKMPEDIIQVPTYTTSFDGFLSTDSIKVSEKEEEKEVLRPKRTCFNCLGDHAVSECSEPLDQNKIGQNRRAHMANRPSNVRYHELVNNKYGHLAPGAMSEDLRQALGLRKHQVSEMIYRMRVIGYPPGWLMEAREQTGEIVLFGGDGRAVCQPGGEDGEVSAGAKYQPEKLVEYPGFNTDLPAGCKDESRWYDMPAMNHEHNISYWREVMGKNRATPYRKRKMKPETTGHIDAGLPTLDLTQDAEASAVATPAARQKLKRKSGYASLEEGEVSSSEESSQKKKKSKKDKKSSINDTIDLVSDCTQDTVVLDDDISSLLDTNPSPVPQDPATQEEDDDETSKDSNTRSSKSKSKKESGDGTSDGCSTLESDSNPGTPAISSTPAANRKVKRKKHRRAGSKGFVCGAVIPKSITEYTDLPDADKWMVDVTDHILFENLPDALGTWNNMKGLMNKVRSKMGDLRAEDD